MERKRLRSECLICLGKKHMDKYPEDATEEQKLQYVRRILQILTEAREEEAAPVVVNRIAKLREEMFGIIDEYGEVKKYFNKLMLEKETDIWQKILAANDSLLMAAKYAMVGNYIDFGALAKVDEDKLNQILCDVENIEANFKEYTYFVEELKTCKSLAYLTDNCGEIVMDKLFMKAIKEQFPDVSITAIVRGGNVLNDATMEDAMQVGLGDYINVIDNGNNIAGTWEKALSKEAMDVLSHADVILSKGQANYETLRYCGRNIYYLFLCKCEMLAKDCNVPKFTGMFLSEKKLRR